MKKLFALLLALAMVFSMGLGAVAEETAEEAIPELAEPVAGQYTYRSAVSTLPSGWNPHTYQTEDDGVALNYTTSSLYSLIFNDANHEVEGREPFDAYVIVPDMAAEMPVDVTEEVKASHPQFNIPESATSGYAWRVKLREDLTWEDGTPIKAVDFVESLKRVLDPKLLNYRAADYSTGTYAVVNAEAYALAGSNSYLDNGVEGVQIADMTKNDEGQYMVDDKLVYIGVDYALNWTGGDTLKNYVETYGEDYFGLDTWEDLLAVTDEYGVAPCTDENLALLSGVTTTNANWGETDADLYNYLLIVDEHFAEDYSFDNVGLYASGEYELTFVYSSALEGFYLTTYGMGTQYLVKTDLYDECLKETETASGTVWTSTYGTSADTYASYGPYRISDYQADKSMHFVKNENWYGWNDGNHEYVDPVDGQTYQMYQTTDIDLQYVRESNTMRQMFLAGQLATYGLQAEDFDQYRNSEYYYVTPAETIFFLLFNGYETVINEREAAADFDATTTDLQMQMLESFRRACAVSIDRELMAATVSPQRTGGYAFVGDTYIYDPETAAYYRDTPQAKQALVDFYSIDLADYNNDLDAAVDAITGYDPVTAAELFQQAYEEGLELGYITDEDGDGISDQTVTMVYAMSAELNNFLEKTLAFLNDSLNGAAAGTGLEGKISITPSAPVGNEWSNNLRNGTMDTQLAGWSSTVALDPFSLADVWTDVDQAYWGQWYNADDYDMTLTIGGTELTMSVRDWALCLNGTMVTVDGVDYNFGYGQADVEDRLTILAAIERHMLTSYNCVPIMQDGGGSLLSQQMYYVVEEYNPILKRGGIQYLKYNYDDAEWAAFVAEQGGILQY